MQIEVWPGRPYPLGATFDGAGTNFAVYSEVATHVELCLFDERGNETRLPLPESTAFCWHGYLPARRPGPALRLPRARSVEPARGPALQPAQAAARPVRASAIDGEVEVGRGRLPLPLRRRQTALNDADSAPFMPKSVVVNPYFDWVERPAARRRRGTRRIIYECHVKGFTQLMHEVPETLRGTYAGLAHPAAIELPAAARRHRRRADARAPVRRTTRTLLEQGPAQLLGLQHHRLLRAAPRLQRIGRARRSRCRSSRRWSRRSTRPASR